MNFWYQTPQEKNIKLMQKTADERRRLQKKTNWGDLSMITFPAVMFGRCLMALPTDRLYVQAVVRSFDLAGIRTAGCCYSLERSRAHDRVLQFR